MGDSDLDPFLAYGEGDEVEKEGDKWCVTIRCAITFKAKNLKIRLPRWTGYSEQGNKPMQKGQHGTR